MANLRRFIAAVSTVAIISSLVVTTAFAGTFTDVPANAYYYEAVEALVDAGVVDGTKGTYNPAANLTRQEAAKFVVEAADLTADLPATATFVDVPTTLWSFEPVEIAYANQVVSGYSHKPGYYGPTDTVTREQYAKMVVEAFGLDEYTPSEPTFSDVTPDMWSYEYVETAYHWSVVNGYSNGKFGATDKIVRQDGAMMTNNAMNAEERTAGDDDDDDDNDTSNGNVDVSYSDEGPETGDFLLVDESGNTVEYRALVGMYDVEASGGDVEVTNVTFTRKGYVVDGDIDDMYLYVDGELVADSASNTATKTFEFTEASGLFTIDSGDTVSMELRVNLSTDVAGGQAVGFDLTGMTEFDDTVEGPLMSTADSTLATVNANFDAAFTVGDNALGATNEQLAEFDLEISNNDVNVEALTFAIVGTLSTSDLSSFRLVNEDDEEIATAETMDDAKTVTFSGLDLTLDNNETYKIYGDIDAGASRTFQFTVDADYESYVYDAENDVRVQLTGDSSASTTIAAGDFQVDLADDSPLGGVADAANDVVLAEYEFRGGGEVVKVTGLVFAATATGGDEVLKDVKVLVDGTQKGSTIATLVADGTTDASFTFGSTFKLNPGETKVLTIVADLDGANIVDTDTIQIVGQTAADVDYTLVDSNTDAGLQLPDGNQLVVATGTLSYILSGDSPESAVIGMGETVEIGRWVLSSNNEDVTLREANLTLATTTGITTVASSAKLVLYKDGAKLQEVSRSIKGTASCTSAGLWFGNNDDQTVCTTEEYANTTQLMWALAEGEDYELALEVTLKPSATGASAPASGDDLAATLANVIYTTDTVSTEDAVNETDIAAATHDIRAARIALAEVSPTSFTGSATTDTQVMKFSVAAASGLEKATMGGIKFTLSTNAAAATGTGDFVVHRSTSSGVTVAMVSNANIDDAATAEITAGDILDLNTDENLSVGDTLTVAGAGGDTYVVVTGVVSLAADTYNVVMLADGSSPATVGAGAATADGAKVFANATTLYVPFQNESLGQISAGSSQTYSVTMDTTGFADTETLNIGIISSSDVTWFDNDEGTSYALTALFTSPYLQEFAVQAEYER